jgi:hypothetical protein
MSPFFDAPSELGSGHPVPIGDAEPREDCVEPSGLKLIWVDQ